MAAEKMERLVIQIRLRLNAIDRERNKLEDLLGKLDTEIARDKPRAAGARRVGGKRKASPAAITSPAAIRRIRGTAATKRVSQPRVKTSVRGSGTNGKVTRKDLIRQAKNLGIKGTDRMTKEAIEATIKLRTPMPNTLRPTAAPTQHKVRRLR